MKHSTSTRPSPVPGSTAQGGVKASTKGSAKSSAHGSGGPGSRGGRSRPAQAAGAGMPRYIATNIQLPSNPAAEREAQARAQAPDQGAARASGHGGAPSAAVQTTPLARQVSRQIVNQAGSGQALPSGWSQQATRLGAQPEQVRVHADSAAQRLTASMGANAVTVGRDIFFAPGRYAPDTHSGGALLRHELTHVGQQGGEPVAPQCDLTTPQPTDMGIFNMAMITQAAPPGLMGTISFMPDTDGPYSAEIGLVQAINITDVPGTSSGTPNTPVDWRNVTDGNSITPANPGGTVGTEGGRMDLMTTGNDGAPAGTYIDSMTANNPRGSAIGPNYVEHFGNSRQFGWLRSETDVGPAQLFDYPSFSFDTNFDFETVAKGTDNQVVYGALEWGFQIRSGAVVATSEYARAGNDTSATFDEALERFRGYFTHEPIVIYFDTGSDQPMAGEEAKLDGIQEYLDNYPDATLGIDGFADIRGTEQFNFRLSDQRAQTVQALVLAQGIAAGRIDWAVGVGETQDFSQHGTAPGAAQPVDAGRLRANRRVVISFNRSSTTAPIVVP